MIETIERVPQPEQLAYKQPEAAKLLGISRITLWRRIKDGLIIPTKDDRTITREELLRYLHQQMASRPSAPVSAPAKTRVPRSQYKPIPLNA